MKKPLYDKIISYLQNGLPISVNITPVMKGIEITLKSEINEVDRAFFEEEYSGWFYDEGSVKLDSPIADSFDFIFQIEDFELLCTANYMETNNPWFEPVREHDVTEIFSDEVSAILSKYLKLDIYKMTGAVKNGVLLFYIDYESEFKTFKVNFSSNEVDFQKEDLDKLKKGIETIIKNWGTRVFVEEDTIFTVENAISEEFVIHPDE